MRLQAGAAWAGFGHNESDLRFATAHTVISARTRVCLCSGVGELSTPLGPAPALRTASLHER